MNNFLILERFEVGRIGLPNGQKILKILADVQSLFEDVFEILANEERFEQT